jgi:thioredoxin-related protein
VSLLSAEHVQWRANYDTAHQEALKTDKLLMVLLVEDNCPSCKKILEITFLNQPYIENINERFVSVIVKKGQQESYPLEMLYSMKYPALFFLDKEELFVGKNIFGYISPDEFKNIYATLFKK